MGLQLQTPPHTLSLWQVASNLVNLGNAFCDQQKHVEAVPVYLRALAIDEKVP